MRPWIDEGAGCCCVQTISYSLLFKWFRAAVLPLDPVLELRLLGGVPKRCASCGEEFAPGSNRAQYCLACSVVRRKAKEAQRQRERYAMQSKKTRQSATSPLSGRPSQRKGSVGTVNQVTAAAELLGTSWELS